MHARSSAASAVTTRLHSQGTLNRQDMLPIKPVQILHHRCRSATTSRVLRVEQPMLVQDNPDDAFGYNSSSSSDMACILEAGKGSS